MSQETLESRCAHLLFHGDDSEQLSTLLLLGQIEQQQQQQQQALGTLGIDADGVEGVEVGMGEVVGGQTGPQGVLSFPRRLVPGTDRTLLMACAKQGRTQCLRLLISMLLRNQGVDQQTAQGYSALHYAAYAGHIPALDALLSAGASLSLRNQAGETAYDAAVAGGRWEAAGLFEAHPRFALAQAQARMQRQMQTQMQSPVQTQVQVEAQAQAHILAPAQADPQTLVGVGVRDRMEQVEQWDEDLDGVAIDIESHHTYHTHDTHDTEEPPSSSAPLKPHQLRDLQFTHQFTQDHRVLALHLTQKLRDLDTSTPDVVFTSTLSSDGRKFVHILSRECGLRSWSSGEDDSRFITVGRAQKQTKAKAQTQTQAKTEAQSMAGMGEREGQGEEDGGDEVEECEEDLDGFPIDIDTHGMEYVHDTEYEEAGTISAAQLTQAQTHTQTEASIISSSGSVMISSSSMSRLDAALFRLRVCAVDRGGDQDLLGLRFLCLASAQEKSLEEKGTTINSHSGDDLYVGRAGTNHAVLPDLSLSKQHAILTFRPAYPDFPGGFSVVDLGSKHGTFVNDRRVGGQGMGQSMGQSMGQEKGQGQGMGQEKIHGQGMGQGQAGDGESAIHDASAGIDGLVQGGRGQVQGQGGLDLQEGDEVRFGRVRCLFERLRAPPTASAAVICRAFKPAPTTTAPATTAATTITTTTAPPHTAPTPRDRTTNATTTTNAAKTTKTSTKASRTGTTAASPLLVSAFGSGSRPVWSAYSSSRGGQDRDRAARGRAWTSDHDDDQINSHKEHGDAPKKRKFADEGGDGGLKAMTVYQQALELLKPGNQGAQGTMHRPDPLQEAAEAAESARAAQEAVLEKGRGLLSKLGWAEGRALGRVEAAAAPPVADQQPVVGARGARPGIGAPAPAPRKAKAYEKMLSRYQQQR